MINKAILIGYVGQNPETVNFLTGGKIVKFSLATSERWTDKATGEKREATEWHTVVVHAPGVASFVEQYVSKGDLLYIEGKLETRQWEDQTGAKRWSTEIAVRPYGGAIKLLTGGGRNSEAGTRAAAQAKAHAPVNEPLDDEIPF